VTRMPLTEELKHQVMYDSAYVCAICQDDACQIHHIDEDHSNNDVENLIAVCMKHHGEAHTRRQLAQNLTPAALRVAKTRWHAEVEDKRRKASSVSGQKSIATSDFLSLGIAWGYINHARVVQMAHVDRLSERDKQIFDYCHNRRIIDTNGVLIRPANAPVAESYIRNSVYDWFEHGDDQRLHMLYTAFVDQVSRIGKPIHLDRHIWPSKAAVLSLIQAGSMIFIRSNFYFKAISETPENEHRRCRTIKGKVEIECFVNTFDMFGTTSMTVSFTGHQTCSALLLVKSVDDSGSKIKLTSTPIALGVGFQ
jgi:hypothetical protein